MVLAPGKFAALNAQPISEQQQEAADKTGVSRQTIVAIENRKYFPTLELAFRIAHVFKVQLEDAFT
ncbi:MAG: helix-turn-helix transcriptional regulator, partial [Bacteroidales bacterium]|nr:helix-turn-helix transcriptional regulator [Bacteroidales bacterium]